MGKYPFNHRDIASYVFEELWEFQPSDMLIDAANSYLSSITEDNKLFMSYPMETSIRYIAFMTLGYGIIHSSYLNKIWQEITTTYKKINDKKTPEVFYPLFLLTYPYRYGEHYGVRVENILKETIDEIYSRLSPAADYIDLDGRALYWNSVASFKTPYDPPECKSAAKNILKLSKSRLEYFKSNFGISEYEMRRRYNKLGTIIWWLHPLSEILRYFVQTRTLRSNWFELEKRILEGLEPL